MSWQAYADRITSQGCTSGALYGLDNASEWAKSAGSKATASEAQTILSRMSSNSTEKFSYGGQDFIVLRNTGDVLYGKVGAGGITAAKSGKALVVGVYDSNVQPGHCNNVVEGLASYLSEQGC